VERVAKETGFSTRRIYELVKVDKRLLSSVERTDDSTELG
jgi:hypothetical protein